MSFDLARSTSLLARTPELLSSWLRGLDATWIEADEGADTFSPLEVLGHLVHGEHTDWIPRAERILQYGERLPFEPFDRFAQRSSRASLEERLDEFAALRRANLATLAGWELGPAELALTGMHPELGRVTLAQLLATWTVHDQVHVGQIARVLAKGLRDEVGPWRAYLPTLER